MNKVEMLRMFKVKLIMYISHNMGTFLAGRDIPTSVEFCVWIS